MRSQTRRSSKSLITKDGPPLDGGPSMSEMNKKLFGLQSGALLAQ
jgi:hypothetical protein